VGYYPGQSPDEVVAGLSARIRAKAQALAQDLQVEISTRGHRSPGCVYDLEAPAMRALADAHRQVTGKTPEPISSTATTDGRHFRLLTDIPVTNYGPLARNIHGLDEAVSLASMQRVTTTMARFIVDWCGVRPV
jgi:acetylornithine deacetylase